MIEAGLVASGLTGAWVRTVQGLVFLVAIVFYLYVDEPQRRKKLFARFRRADDGERRPRADERSAETVRSR
jgi:simple sugar transport system permease protein